MRKYRILILLFGLALTAISCNRDAGEGGTGTVQGYVKQINHPDDDYSLATDTTDAMKTDVFIVYSNSDFYGDDVETDDKGFYKFKYLTKGDYTVFAYSTLHSGEKIPVKASVSIDNGATGNVSTMYIHSGKALGTSILKGKVYALYYHNNSYRSEGWAYEHRVYIRKAGDDYQFDDVRVGIDGIFAFQKLQPGDYEVFTFTEDEDEVPSPIIQEISVDEVGQVIQMEPDTTFVVKIQV